MPTALTRTVAGLPAWVWGAALGGGLLVGVYLRRRSKAATDAAAGTDSAGAQDGPNLDANGNPMSGTASGDTADPSLGMGELPGQAYTGFGGGSPPAYPPAEARIDPALLATLRALAKREKAEEAADRKHKKKHHAGTAPRTPNGGHPRGHTATGGAGTTAPRTTADHYPAGTTSGVVA